ncbi:zinc metalloproteinase-disintegrin-like halysase isoform X2 [Hyperolius riggenbachi]|uniref:zinc metalloproteinase-disintegrin-like halysase isoform X2 n=1 Tax=Hyperolius riggenbachi TaxID=752182 RepID=UPI0035A33CF5
MVMLGAALLLLVLLDSKALALPEEQKYEVVYPERLHVRNKRDTQSKYPDLVHYGLALNGRPVELQLEKTEDLISDNYTETRYQDDGSPVTTIPAQQDHCYYQGHVKNDKSSQVSLSLCHGLSGVITTQEQRLLIEPLNNTESGAHAVYAFQEQDTPKTCGVDQTMYNDSIMTKISFSTNGAEQREFLKSRKYIQLYVVADNSMYIKYNRNMNAIRERIFGIVNFVNVVYKPLKTFVALTGIEIWDRTNQIEVVSSADLNLRRFSEWREKNLLPRKPNDNAQFITHIDFDGSTVGLAWVRTLCSTTHSAGVIQDHNTNYIAVGATMAHEMGHNLGMDHDGNSCRCDSKSCIMAPVLSHNTPREFSSCSHQNYQDFILNSMPRCMKDKPKREDVMTPPVCGNKFTENGEECDCGTVEECTDKCCDAATCKIKEGAQCAEGECCSDCRLKQAGSLCREAKDDCDLSEMCDGKSSVCPADRFRMNGFACSNGNGHCYNGKCPTLQSQCLTYWGSGSVPGSNSCFAINRRGSPGFCRHSGANVVCPAQDVKCGVLFCSGGSTLPVVSNYGYFREGSCSSLNPQVLVEEGTRCAENSTCQGGRCTSINALFAFNARCSAKCQKNAVCNDEQQCQCENGWAPPDCSSSAPQQFNSGYTVLIVIIVLVVIIIVVFVVYKRTWRRKQRRVPGDSSGVANPTFNITNQMRQPHAPYPSSPQVHRNHAVHSPMPPASSQKPPVSAMYPPMPPASSQKPPGSAMYPSIPPASSQKPPVSAMYPPMPPASAQKPQGAQAFLRHTAAPPARPAYPPVPPQAVMPNYRR